MSGGTDSPPVVQIRGLERSFTDGAGRRSVLNGLDLLVEPGELVAIVGASGSGKTSLLNVVGALDREFSGEVRIFGELLSGLSDDRAADLRNRLLGFVFQSYHLLDHLSVLENVAVPLWIAGDVPADQLRARARAALRSVGLEDRAQDAIGPLSGGERQRVAVARAMVHDPRLILADEPTGNLDADTGARVFELLDELRRGGPPGGRAVLIVTHDRNIARRADRVLELQAGKLGPAGGAA